MIVCLWCGVLLCWMMLLNQTLAMAADKSSCRPDVFVLVALFAGKTKTHTHRKKNKQHEQSTIKNYGNWRAVIFYERTQRAAAMGKTFSSTERNARTCQ